MRQPGPEAAPMTTCPRGRGHAPKGRRAHKTPLTRSPAEVRAMCLTLWQSGSEAEPVHPRQPVPKEEAIRQMDMGPTRHTHTTQQKKDPQSDPPHAIPRREGGEVLHRPSTLPNKTQ
ncbi:hypothetical protein MRB53_034450 [Persea americana]|uniref:Uncharacterized protein n=1 Tax=Persea americana TaxID=3435 RepID=A0ACC2K244_PERAE|nr:hypothetical protein MRB53_034450 [Persea americana]